MRYFSIFQGIGEYLENMGNTYEPWLSKTFGQVLQGWNVSQTFINGLGSLANISMPLVALACVSVGIGAIVMYRVVRDFIG